MPVPGIRCTSVFQRPWKTGVSSAGTCTSSGPSTTGTGALSARSSSTRRVNGALVASRSASVAGAAVADPAPGRDQVEHEVVRAGQQGHREPGGAAPVRQFEDAALEVRAEAGRGLLVLLGLVARRRAAGRGGEHRELRGPAGEGGHVVITGVSTPDGAAEPGRAAEGCRGDLAAGPVHHHQALDLPALGSDPQLAALRRGDPVARIRLPHGDGEAWPVTRYRDVRLVTSDPRFVRSGDYWWVRGRSAQAKLKRSAPGRADVPGCCAVSRQSLRETR